MQMAPATMCQRLAGKKKAGGSAGIRLLGFGDTLAGPVSVDASMLAGVGCGLLRLSAGSGWAGACQAMPVRWRGSVGRLLASERRGD